MAATTRKSKPNESQSFPDPSAMRDAVAAPTHFLPHKLSNYSTGFHPAYDDSLSLTSDLSYIMYHSMPVQPRHPALPPWDPLSRTIILENWYFFGSEHDPLDNVK